MDILSKPRHVDSGVLMIEEIERTAGVIAWLEEKIASLDEEGGVNGDGGREGFIGEVQVVTHEDGMGAQGNSVSLTKTETRREVSHWWRMLEEERKHLIVATTAALRTGLEERRVRLAERGVDALEAAMAMALMDLGLDPHNERVRAVVGNRLRQALENGDGNRAGFLAPAQASDLARAQVRVIDAKSSEVHSVDF